MKGSLQEQMLKSGLIDEDRLNSAKKQTKKPAKKKRKASAKRPPRVTTTTKPAVVEDPKKQKELRVEVKKLLRSYKLNDKSGEIAYNYTVNNQIKRFYVNEKQQKELIDGKLSIANWNEISYLIPTSSVEELRTLYPKIDIYINEADKNTLDKDDPYAAYEIPDDIKW